jgi:hypothetical protein
MISLPEPARCKLALLEQTRDAAAAAAGFASTRISELRRTASHDPAAAADNEQVLQTLLTQRNDQSARHRAAAQLLAQIGYWLGLQRGNTVMVAAPSPAVSLADGETVLQAIDRVRGEISDRQGRLLALRTAPPPKSALNAQVAAMVKNLAEQGQPRLTLNGDTLRANFGDPKAYATSISDMVRLLAWLDPEQMQKRLQAAVQQMPEAAVSATPKEKAQAEAELPGQIEHLERIEEALIERALSTGTYVERRSDADPRAVLGIMQQSRAARSTAA